MPNRGSRDGFPRQRRCMHLSSYNNVMIPSVMPPEASAACPGCVT